MGYSSFFHSIYNDRRGPTCKNLRFSRGKYLPTFFLSRGAKKQNFTRQPIGVNCNQRTVGVGPATKPFQNYLQFIYNLGPLLVIDRVRTPLIGLSCPIYSFLEFIWTQPLASNSKIWSKSVPQTWQLTMEKFIGYHSHGPRFLFGEPDRPSCRGHWMEAIFGNIKLDANVWDNFERIPWKTMHEVWLGVLQWPLKNHIFPRSFVSHLGRLSLYYIPGTHLSFVFPPKECLFQSKQGSFGFQVYYVYDEMSWFLPKITTY